MLRAMDSAVAGLRAHQNKMDVIGHNLANVNTFGFKAQTYSFKEAVYQTSTPSTGNSGGAGGANAAQYGYGTLMGTIGMDMTASTPTQFSGLNAAINGEGFFLTYPTAEDDLEDLIPDDKTDPTVKTIQWGYTRVGQFTLDSQGYLVDGSSNFVYGIEVDPATGQAKPPADADAGYQLADLKPIRMPLDANNKAKKADSIEVDALGRIKVVVDGVSSTIGVLAIASFQNPNGLTKAGGTYYNANDDDNTGAIEVGIPGGDNAELMPGYIEASNVDLAKEFAEMITTHRGFQANSKMITVSDEMLSELVSMKR